MNHQVTNSLPSPAVLLGGLAFAAAIINGGIGAIDFGSDALNVGIPLCVSAITGFLGFVTGQRSRDDEVRHAEMRADSAIARAESALDALTAYRKEQAERMTGAEESTELRERH